MSSVATAEKRSAPRIPVSLKAHCQLGTRYVREAITDLSSGGFYLRTREQARAGTPVRVALALPYADGPRYCTLVGCVARIARDARGVLCGLGVAFSHADMAPLDWRTLEAFLRSLGGGR